MIYSAYVIMHNGQYCSFHPHKVATMHDNPLKASLYSTERLAENRISVKQGGWAGFYIGNKGRVNIKQFSVHKIEMELK